MVSFGFYMYVMCSAITGHNVFFFFFFLGGGGGELGRAKPNVVWEKTPENYRNFLS